MSTLTFNHVTPDEEEEIRDRSDEKYATPKYDCYPSWQGECCDNIPHYKFCHFVEKKKGQKMPSNITTQQHQHGTPQAESQIT